MTEEQKMLVSEGFAQLFQEVNWSVPFTSLLSWQLLLPHPFDGLSKTKAFINSARVDRHSENMSIAYSSNV
jgi:hypothetical protein